MKLRHLVWRELAVRRGQLVTGLIAVLLGVAAVVAIHTVSVYSERAVERELAALGANILVLPKAVGAQNYYTADLNEKVMPEDYVARIAMSGLQGVQNLSPKLSLPANMPGMNFTITGILPKSEFQAKAAWGGLAIFTKRKGCVAVSLPGEVAAEGKARGLARTRVIQDLAQDEALLGADVGQNLAVTENSQIELRGRKFRVVGILPTTGTIDDTRIFIHLHTVQEMAGAGAVINAIEIVGCCKTGATSLVDELNALLPEAKVVTIGQVIATQVSTNALMGRLTWTFLAIIVVVGGAGIANAMYANVAERRREIATLMALGASRGQVSDIFLLKALIIGLAGGLGGYAIGTLAAVLVGPQIAGMSVFPIAWLIPAAAIGTALISLLASWLPARRAGGIDPTLVFQEV